MFLSTGIPVNWWEGQSPWQNSGGGILAGNSRLGASATGELASALRPRAGGGAGAGLGGVGRAARDAWRWA